jgi:hypothetical protein
VVTKKVGTKLTVTPHINQKKYVLMDVKQSLEGADETQPVRSAGGVSDWPIVDASEFTASIAVRSGETIVLGGLVKTTKIDNESKIPILGDIPLLGALFRYKWEKEQSEDVVVFLTPYVLNTPEDIEDETVRRKDAVGPDEMWPRPWSASRIVGTPEERAKAKAAAAAAPAPAPAPGPLEEEDLTTAIESMKKKESGDASPAADQDVDAFVRQQEQRLEESLRKVDERIENEMLKSKRNETIEQMLEE